MNWLEVSLCVSGELAEAVADVLGRFAPNGVMTEQGVKFINDEDEGTASGPITVRAYLPVDAQIDETRHRLEESLYYLGMIQPLPSPIFKAIADQNWMEAWKEHYKPIPIGRRMLILPAWLDSPDNERIGIKIDPGMAFGTGTHPTTQLCLKLIEKILDADAQAADQMTLPSSDIRKSPTDIRGFHSGFRVIDIGCGSGILSIAALKLGAKVALAVDLDPEAIKNSRENAATNNIGQELLLGIGSVSDIMEGKFAFRKAQLVLVNILAPVIIRLFEAGLMELLEPEGKLVLSGILREQVKDVVGVAYIKGLRIDEQIQIDDWVALVLTRDESARPLSKEGNKLSLGL